jgi:hypothetical protein
MGSGGTAGRWRVAMNGRMGGYRRICLSWIVCERRPSGIQIVARNKSMQGASGQFVSKSSLVTVFNHCP